MSIHKPDPDRTRKGVDPNLLDEADAGIAEVCESALEDLAELGDHVGDVVGKAAGKLIFSGAVAVARPYAEVTAGIADYFARRISGRIRKGAEFFRDVQPPGGFDRFNRPLDAHGNPYPPGEWPPGDDGGEP